MNPTTEPRADAQDIDWDCPACGAVNFDIVVMWRRRRARMHLSCINCERPVVVAVSVSVHLVALPKGEGPW